MEILKNIESKNFKLIFSTAYSEYAVKAFEENAIDYLLKPYTPERLYRAFDKVLDLKSKEENNHHQEFIKKEPLKKMILKKRSEEHIVDISYIDYCFIKEGSTTIVTHDSQYFSDLSLSYLEEELPSYFARTHRNYIVNLKKVCKICEAEEMELIVNAESKIPVSRRNRAMVKKKLQEL